MWLPINYISFTGQGKKHLSSSLLSAHEWMAELHLHTINVMTIIINITYFW